MPGENHPPHDLDEDEYLEELRAALRKAITLLNEAPWGGCPAPGFVLVGISERDEFVENALELLGELR